MGTKMDVFGNKLSELVPHSPEQANHNQIMWRWAIAS